MGEEKEYPESLQKLVKTNDGLHEAVNDVLKDDAFIVYNKCAAAEHFRVAFSRIDTAKSILGYEPPTPPSDDGEEEEGEEDEGEGEE